MVEAGLVTALGFIFILMRLNLRRVAGYAIIFDLAITLGLMWIFKGTYAGMMTGIFAGCVISAFLTLVRMTIGFERLELIRANGELSPRWRWVYHPPRSRTERRVDARQERRNARRNIA